MESSRPLLSRSDSLWHVFQRFVPLHISSYCTQIWVNLLLLLWTHYSFSHLYCPCVVTPPPLICLSVFFCCIFSKWTFIFVSVGSYVYFLIWISFCWTLFQTRTNPVYSSNMNGDTRFGLLAHIHT